MDQLVQNTIPIAHRPLKDKRTPYIVNMVGTVCILPQEPDHANGGRRYRLPLEAISMHLGPCSQFAPWQFAACVVKITNSTTDSTVLVFGSGKLVLVSHLSEWHIRYMSQYLRLLIERIPCPMVDEHGRHYMGTLKGRTVFERNVAHNVVGHGSFDFTIDLEALRLANPEAVSFVGDSFPAAMTNVWLTLDKVCQCKKKKRKAKDDNDDNDEEARVTLSKVLKNNKCRCTIKCLIFKTGKIVLIGARRAEDINAVFFRMFSLVSQFKEGTRDFYHTLGSVLASNHKTGKNSNNNKREPTITRNEMDEIQAITIALGLARETKKKRLKTTSLSALADTDVAIHGSTALMRLAEAGRLEQVQMTLQMEPEQMDMKDSYGRSAVERLKSIFDKTPEQVACLTLLEQWRQGAQV